MSKANTAKPRTRNISAADKVAAERLRALWESAVARRAGSSAPLTQGVIVEAMTRLTGKGSQGLVSQYLRGDLALNYLVLLIFSREIGCSPEDIRQDLPEQILTGKVSVSKAPDALHSQLISIEALTVGLSALLIATRKHRPVEAAEALHYVQHAKVPTEVGQSDVLRTLAEALGAHSPSGAAAAGD